MEVLGNVLVVLINVLAVGAVGAVAYYRLKDWRTFSGLVKVRRLRDVVFSAMLIFMASSIVSLVARAMLRDA